MNEETKYIYQGEQIYIFYFKTEMLEGEFSELKVKVLNLDQKASLMDFKINLEQLSNFLCGKIGRQSNFISL